jgi:hypothetical protein
VKLSNEYARDLGRLYEDTPKAVWAALAYSFAMRLNEDSHDAVPIALCAEWAALHRAGIVPQRAPEAERIIFGGGAK